MKRNPRKVKWTKAFRKAAGKEMTIVSIHAYFPDSMLNQTAGLYHRVREAQEYPSQIRQRLDCYDSEGNEESWGDQSSSGTCLLQTQVRSAK